MDDRVTKDPGTRVDEACHVHSRQLTFEKGTHIPTPGRVKLLLLPGRSTLVESGLHHISMQDKI